MVSKNTVVNALDEQLTSTATVTDRRVDGERTADPIVTVVPRGGRGAGGTRRNGEQRHQQRGDHAYS